MPTRRRKQALASRRLGLLRPGGRRRKQGSAEVRLRPAARTDELSKRTRVPFAAMKAARETPSELARPACAEHGPRLFARVGSSRPRDGSTTYPQAAAIRIVLVSKRAAGITAASSQHLRDSRSRADVPRTSIFILMQSPSRIKQKRREIPHFSVHKLRILLPRYAPIFPPCFPLACAIAAATNLF